MIFYIILILAPLVYLIILTDKKIEHLKIRKGKEKLPAMLHSYETETKEISRNHFHTSEYAKVTLLNKNGEEITVKLNYSGVGFLYKPFNEDDIIYVFWYAGELYYWYDYQDGLFMYLPSKWPFTK